MHRAQLLGLGLCWLLNAGCSGDTLNAGGEPSPSTGGDTSEGKLVFRTSERYSADLGGLEGADQKCQELAQAAGHTGEFKAWLSTIDVEVWERFTHSSEPYVLSTGVLVANDWSDLTSGELRHAVNQSETPELPPANGADSCNPTVFWSATDERGRQYGDDCDGWTATGEDLRGVLGVTGTNGTWSTFCHGDCASLAPLMCVEQ